MTTSFTQFINAYLAAWPDNVTDPEVSKWTANFERSLRYNNERKNVQEVTLNAGGTYTISLSGQAQADWEVLIVTCVGQGHLDLTGKDSSSSNISSKLPIYGTSVLPGILMVSTYNLTAAPKLVSVFDGTVFEVFTAKCVEDGA